MTIRSAELVKYQKCPVHLKNIFQLISFTYMPRSRNQFVEAIATLASMLKLLDNAPLKPIDIQARGDPAYCLNVEEEPNGELGYHNVKVFLKKKLIIPMPMQLTGEQYNVWPTISF